MDWEDDRQSVEELVNAVRSSARPAVMNTIAMRPSGTQGTPREIDVALYEQDGVIHIKRALEAYPSGYPKGKAILIYDATRISHERSVQRMPPTGREMMRERIASTLAKIRYWANCINADLFDVHQQDIEEIIRVAANAGPTGLKRRRVRDRVLRPIADYNDQLTRDLARQIRLDSIYRPERGGVDPAQAAYDASPEAKLEIVMLAMRKGIGGRALTNMTNALRVSPTEAWQRVRTSGQRAESALGNAAAAVIEEQHKEEAE